MADAGDPNSGTIFSILASIVALVVSWIGWARWSAKNQHETHAESTQTLREVITLLKDGQTELRGELAAMRLVQQTQATEIATLKEQVRQLESQRDTLLAENATQKSEIIALNIRLVDARAELVRCQGELSKAVADVQIQEALNERLNGRLKAFERAPELKAADPNAVPPIDLNG